MLRSRRGLRSLIYSAARRLPGPPPSCTAWAGARDPAHSVTPPAPGPAREPGCAGIAFSRGLCGSGGGGMDKTEFLEIFKKLKAELLEDTPLFKHTPESRAWVEQNLEHNVPGGKLNRGLSVVDSAAALVSSKGDGASLTEEQRFQAAVLGWCIEWLQAYFLVMDDIMDKSITRRGQPCWYRMPKVGMIALNDAIILNSHIFLLLHRHFLTHPKYFKLVQLFNEVSYQTACGQMLDLITTPEGEIDLTKYTMDTYLKIVQFKTAYYSFYLPVASALLLTEQWEDTSAEKAKEILVDMGTYFQVQDDVLDCFGDPKVIGKIGTDIEDSKCSWLVVQALQRASLEQKARIEANYGKADPAAVSAIKDIYNELQLKAAFDEYEAKCYSDLVASFEQVDPALKDVLSLFLKKIFKRSS